jgi:hypothetical protein
MTQVLALQYFDDGTDPAPDPTKLSSQLSIICCIGTGGTT